MMVVVVIVVVVVVGVTAVFTVARNKLPLQPWLRYHRPSGHIIMERVQHVCKGIRSS